MTLPPRTPTSCPVCFSSAVPEKRPIGACAHAAHTTPQVMVDVSNENCGHIHTAVTRSSSSSDSTGDNPVFAETWPSVENRGIRGIDRRKFMAHAASQVVTIVPEVRVCYVYVHVGILVQLPSRAGERSSSPFGGVIQGNGSAPGHPIGGNVPASGLLGW